MTLLENYFMEKLSKMLKQYPAVLNVDDRDRDQQATSFNLRTNTTRDCFESTVRPYGISPIACLLSAMTLRSSALPPKL
ncbi:4-aminobutyrate aminotransferase [Dirofilaria immitis]